MHDTHVKKKPERSEQRTLNTALLPGHAVTPSSDTAHPAGVNHGWPLQRQAATRVPLTARLERGRLPHAGPLEWS